MGFENKVKSIVLKMDRGSRISQVEPDDSVATFQRESGTSESTAEDGIMDTNVGMI